MESSVAEKIAMCLRKADEALLEADTLYTNKLYNGTVSRSYYAIFHASSALLLTKQLEFSKHSAVISALGQHFAKQGSIEKRYHRAAIEAYDARQIAEYDIFKQINEQFAEKALREAREFVQMTERFLA